VLVDSHPWRGGEEGEVKIELKSIGCERNMGGEDDMISRRLMRHESAPTLLNNLGSMKLCFDVLFGLMEVLQYVLRKLWRH
jgi:hypothetical protein